MAILIVLFRQAILLSAFPCLHGEFAGDIFHLKSFFPAKAFRGPRKVSHHDSSLPPADSSWLPGSELISPGHPLSEANLLRAASTASALYPTTMSTWSAPEFLSSKTIPQIFTVDLGLCSPRHLYGPNRSISTKSQASGLMNLSPGMGPRGCLRVMASALRHFVQELLAVFAFFPAWGVQNPLLRNMDKVASAPLCPQSLWACSIRRSVSL